jgi:hypothetical protein
LGQSGGGGDELLDRLAAGVYWTAGQSMIFRFFYMYFDIKLLNTTKLYSKAYN